MRGLCKAEKTFPIGGRNPRAICDGEYGAFTVDQLEQETNQEICPENAESQKHVDQREENVGILLALFRRHVPS